MQVSTMTPSAAGTVKGESSDVRYDVQKGKG